MIDLSGLPLLDVAIGLAFLYFLLSIICSSITEIIASIFKMRAKNLEAGMRALLGSQAAAEKFFGDWRIKTLGTPKWFKTDPAKRARNPSYVSPASAALVVLDTFAPAAAAEAKKIAPDQEPSRDQLAAVEATLENMTDPDAKKWLTHLIADARGDVDQVRARIEDRFNDLMDRATGWYKRKTQVVVFLVALAVAGGLNADTLNVADRLARDEALRAHVVAQAQKAGNADTTKSPTAKDVESQINAARASALPLGWAGENVPDYPLVAVVLEKTAGIVITAFALMLGAPFWFDVLGKFARLRSTGNRIGTAKDDALAPSDRDDRLRRSTVASPGG